MIQKIKNKENLDKYIRYSFKCKYSQKNCGKKLDTIYKIINHICKIHLMPHQYSSHLNIKSSHLLFIVIFKIFFETYFFVCNVVL